VRVDEIEVHEISVEYVDWNAYPLNHYYGPSRRTVYVVHTDNGLVGLGEGGGTEPQEVIDRYIGSNPFEWVGDETSLALGTAMYDLMGQAAGVPVYQLIGQKYRSWVPVSSWTVSTHPDRMAEAVKAYASQGYSWMKFHLSPFENVFDQTEAMQAVAPEGFRIHYDFTMHGTDDHMVDLMERLSRFDIAGCFEDPLPGEDIEGYVELRRRSRLPVVLHHFPMRATYEILARPGDAYMLGHYKIGEAIRRAGLFEASDSPFMVQNVGGTITRAMVTHMMAAFPTGTFHFVDSSETLKQDVVAERLEPVNGFIRVPEKPGLGLTLDREALEGQEKWVPAEQEKWIVRSRYSNGTRMYNLGDPKDPIFMVRPVERRLIPMRYDALISTDYWDDDGTPEYREMLERVERDGIVIEQ
jgi:L-alanine-DL-glutamate epimerase-like enolase superfamily enzyme